MPRTVRASVGGACEDSLKRSKAPCPISRDEQDDGASFALACACAVLAFLGLCMSRASAQFGPAVPPAAASSGEGRESSSPRSTPATQRAGGPDARHFDGLVRPFLARHCLDCHGGEKPKGDSPGSTRAGFRRRGQPGTVAQRARATRCGHDAAESETSPAGARRPACPTGSPTEWRLRMRAARHPGRVVLRRLNRIEYENTVRDLLGVDVESEGAVAPGHLGRRLR